MPLLITRVLPMSRRVAGRCGSITVVSASARDRRACVALTLGADHLAGRSAPEPRMR
jgi:hypothetical protein